MDTKDCYPHIIVILAKAGIQELPIVVDSMTAHHAWLETMDLAECYALTLYDASYLELALHRSLPLATLDKSLKHAAIWARIEVLS